MNPQGDPIPTSFEEKFAIEELIARYNQAIDQGRYEDFLACWCSDGVFDGLVGPYIGIAAIRKFTDGYDERYRLRLNGLNHGEHPLAHRWRPSPVGEVQMRKTDHQLQAPLYLGLWAKQGSKGVKYDTENTGYGFRPEVTWDSYVSSQPTSCQMKRPPA